MNIIENIKEKARLKNKTIVLPEFMDERVVKAGEIAVNEGIANIILLGNIDEIKKENRSVNLDNIKVIDPKTSELTQNLIEKLSVLRKIEKEQARELLLNDYMYYACMLVKEGLADGVVSGACHSSANTLRPALQIIKTKENCELVSAFFLMDVPNKEYGYNGAFIFSDCGLNQNPNANELACIAMESAKSFKELVGAEPIVAMLSHSTKGSATHDDVNKVVEATKIAKKNSEFLLDGELQLDAAIDKEVAKIKASDSFVAGRANVLIFPDLDAGNIGYKLVERLANAKAYGPITQGIKKPINDLSRGCNVDDIVGAIAITVVQCED
ncbi:MAG: phosphate acetyltransferase [Lactobacillales bacterium]|nr:phosphate acetyltransferase [Lactobacillales bacterium]